MVAYDNVGFINSSNHKRIQHTTCTVVCQGRLKSINSGAKLQTLFYLNPVLCGECRENININTRNILKFVLYKHT
jgi:hypothetical protein